MLMQKFSGEAVARGRIMLMPRLSTRVLRHSRGIVPSSSPPEASRCTCLTTPEDCDTDR